MTQLKAIKPKKAEPQKPKILIFGKPGVGKTWAAMDFPGVYYIDTESGATLSHYTDKLEKAGGVYLGLDQGSLDFATVIAQVKALATEDHGYKTLVIDSISKLYNNAITEEQERLGDKDAFGASKKKPIAYMRRLISWLTRIDMNVILISHERIEYGMSSAGERVEIGHTFDCWDKLEYELDLCLQIIKTGTKRNAFIRKSRLEEFPEETHFPWSYDDFAKKYGKKVIEKKGKTLKLATKEQLDEVKELLDSVNLPDGQEAKWLAKAGVKDWSEMPSDRIAGAINHIKETHTHKEN